MVDRVDRRSNQEVVETKPSPLCARVGRRNFLSASGLFLGSALLAACEGHKPPKPIEMASIDPELLAQFLGSMKEAYQTTQTWLREDFLKAHPLHLLSPVFIPRRDSKSDLSPLSQPTYASLVPGITKEIEKVLAARQQWGFSTVFELEGKDYNGLEGRVTNIYGPDGRISASELLIGSIFDRHLLPNYDVTKSIPELAKLIYVGKGDYTQVTHADGYIEVQDARGFPTQVPFEFLAELADTLFNLPPELFTAPADKPGTFSSRFDKKRAVIYQPGRFFNGAQLIHRKVTRDEVSEWEGRYLTDQDRLVMVKTDNTGMARLRTIEPSIPVSVFPW